MTLRSIVVVVASGAFVALAACGPAARPSVATPPPPPPSSSSDVAALVDPQLELLVTPSPEGHAPFIRAIDAATLSIDMTMFHLTDPAVVDALVRAAQRGVKVRVIVDHDGLTAKGNHAAFDRLVAGGVLARGSSPAFSLTHVKAMVVDGHAAFVTAINLTRDADRTRDLGIVTRESAIVADVDALFAADWRNAETGGHDTPAQHVASLVVSPVTSRGKLLALIHSAHRELLLTVENLGDREIADALAAAVRDHVRVRVVVPACDKNPNALYNLPAAQSLAAAGAEVRMMAGPESPEQPYMHSKMILVDGTTAYVGSVNFSSNSLAKARELGIIFANAAAAAKIRELFETDFARAVPPPSATPARCEDVR